MSLEDFARGLPEDDQLILKREAEGIRFKRYAAEFADLMMKDAWRMPPDETGGTLAELLTEPETPVPWLIEDMIVEGFNHTVTAQYKTGKSSLVMDMVRTIADGSMFLDQYLTYPIPGGGNIGIWNAEMTRKSFGSYFRPLNVQNPDRVVLRHLRGYTLDILNQPDAVDWTKAWLTDNDIRVWVIDTWGKLCSWCGVSENKNDEVGPLLNKIDEIKSETPASTTIITAHTGRGEMQVGTERARGATVLDDWTDVRLVMTKRGTGPVTPRFLHGEGREVQLDEFRIDRDPTTNRLIYGGEGTGRNATRIDDAVDEVALLVAQNPGATSNAIKGMIQSLGNGNDKQAALDRAEAMGLIRREQAETRGRPLLCYPAESAALPSWAQNNNGGRA